MNETFVAFDLDQLRAISCSDRELEQEETGRAREADRGPSRQTLEEQRMISIDPADGDMPSLDGHGVRIRTHPDMALVLLEARTEDEEHPLQVGLDPDAALHLAWGLIEAVLRMPHYEHWPWVRLAGGRAWSKGPGPLGSAD
jgi:hypothetical protein